MPKLYLGGDALRGASTAINAIADGRKAAQEILTDTVPFLPSPSRGGAGGEVIAPSHAGGEVIPSLLHRKATREYGYHPAETALDQRQNFDLVISSLTADEARKEAARCLQCDVICNVCVSVCPNLANFGYEIEPVRYSLEKAVLQDDGTIAFAKDRDFRVDQQYQILNIRDLCNECGNCTTFCPSGGRPFTDKPGVCLSVESLNDEGTGYFLSRLPGKVVLIYREQDSIRTLGLMDGKYYYEFM